MEDFNQWAGFLLGIGMALIVQGEGQVFFTLLFEPLRERKPLSYDLNPLHHIDLKSLPAMIFSGWGWTKKRVIPPKSFPDSHMWQSLVPLSGIIADFLLAGILGSLYMLMPLDFIRIAVEVCIVVAVANMVIPVPPLLLGRALLKASVRLDRHWQIIEYLGTILITGIVLVEHTTDRQLLEAWILSLSGGISRWVLAA